MKASRVFKAGIPALLLLSVLSACQTAQEVFQTGDAAETNPGPCPESFALYEAARLVEFRGSESFENIGFTGEITRVRSLCRYYDNRPIDADLTINMELGRGPAARESTATYEYFVAVTRKNIDVIEKTVFPLTVTFPTSVNVLEVTENIDQIIIPRANDNTSGTNFEIIVGFKLTPEQITFNAAGKRFRVSAGKN